MSVCSCSSCPLQLQGGKLICRWGVRCRGGPPRLEKDPSQGCQGITSESHHDTVHSACKACRSINATMLWEIAASLLRGCPS